MTSGPTYPGVYVEEISIGIKGIEGVETSTTAFVGRAWRGPLDEPVIITSFMDYEHAFGGLWRGSMMSYAVRHFFDNGGRKAIVVRVATRSGAGAAAPATIELGHGTTLAASSPGTWGRNLVATVDFHTSHVRDKSLFNLTIIDESSPASAADSQRLGGTGVRESFGEVSRDPASPRFITKIVAAQSQLVRVTSVGATRPPAATVKAGATTGADGVSTATVDAAALEVAGDATAKTGLNALRKADIFNLLVVPPLTTTVSGSDMPTAVRDVPMTIWAAAAALCKERRALLIVDAPSDWTTATAKSGVASFSAIERDHAALYFPRLRIADPRQNDQPQDFAPSGAVAGVISRMAIQRGIWKSPAGTEAHLLGVLGLSINGTTATLGDKDSGELNPLGVNCIRALPSGAHVVWGARTLDSASEWKYVPVRRLALYIEESIYRGTQWVVFEPNGERLWAQIRVSIGAFMRTLFRDGALQGSKEDEAFFVKCDRGTTTQHDIDSGVVNILVGFAPVKPAEFVLIKIQQRTAAAGA